jgi:hypothetical protein
MSRSRHAGSSSTWGRARRTNSTITALSLAAGLWLGLTAPGVSPVAPPPPVAAATSIAVSQLVAPAHAALVTAATAVHASTPSRANDGTRPVR